MAWRNYNGLSMVKETNGLHAFWALSPDMVLTRLQTTPDGLTGTEAQKRLQVFGYNTLKQKKRNDSLTLFLTQFKSPIIIILLFATGLSFVLRDVTDALIILAIVLISGLLGFWQERGAANAVQRLLSIVQVNTTAFRDGEFREVPVEEAVPGDIVALKAGDIIPGDCLIIESRDFFVDEAILQYRQLDLSHVSKLDEVPYDFIRKRLTILAAKDDTHLMVTKGALSNVLAVCSSAEMPDGQVIDIVPVQEKIRQRFRDLSDKGFRTLGLAYKDMGSQSSMTKDDGAHMIFLGFLVFFDPLKGDIVEVIKTLKGSGVTLKVITGDSELVAASVAERMGFPNRSILNGSDIREMSSEALMERVNSVDIFAEIEPNQKERIILALRRSGNVVGYMGDGINDASALHAADVGISVNSAVDVAKEVADIVLLEKDLRVLANGMLEGRKTFANTLKYVFMATSANFGNMFSMAGASLFLSSPSFRNRSSSRTC